MPPHGSIEHEEEEERDFGPIVQEHQPVQPNQQPNRDDISPGMVMVPSEPILDDPERWSPLICFAFHTKEEASLPKALLEVLWVLHSVMCITHRGDTKEAFLDLKGRPFRVLFSGAKSEKPIIISEEEHTVASEIQIQIRVHSMPPEHYTVLVVRTHVAFSLRHAMIHLLTQNLMQQQANDRRKVINTHARRVREHLGCTWFSEFDRGDGIDWMRTPNNDGFHILFSVASVAQWIRSHYKRMHPEVEEAPPLEGFGSLDCREGSFVDSQFTQQCMLYEKNIDDIVKASHEGAKGGGKSAARAKRPAHQQRSKHRKTTSGGTCPSSPASVSSKANTEAEEMDPADDFVDEEARSKERREALLNMSELGQADGWILDEAQGLTGYPSTSVCIRVVLDFPVDGPLRYDKFTSMIQMLPTSAAMRILQARLNVEGMDTSKLLITDTVDNEECDALLRDKRSLLERPFYSNGDAKWARGFSNAMRAVNARHVHEKLKIAEYWTKMGFSLALTRSAGSDTYTNKRVHMYGTRMKRRHDVFSDGQDTECTQFFREVVVHSHGGKREGCMVQEALIAYIKVMQRTNKDAWSLRPDNLYLLSHLITSDIMLGMNFNGSVVEGAENGIGGTLIVHDGGGAYRAVGIENQYGIVFIKNNGCGADFVMSVLQAMLDIEGMDERMEGQCAKSIEEHVFQAVKRSSELGLFMLTCNVIKGVGGEQTVVHRVTEAGGRHYTTEMRLHKDAMSAAAMQAIVTSVPRMTRTNTPQTCTTTAEDKETKTRVPVKYVQVIVGYLMVCTNNLSGTENYERMLTLSKVARCLPSSADALNTALSSDEMSQQTLTYGEKRYVPSAQHASVIHSPKCKGVFLSAMTVAHFTAFMQWTGMLGKLPLSPIAEEVLDCFYAQIDLTKAFLNRSRNSADDRSRCFEVSKARIMATSLLVTSIQSILAVGRLSLADNKTLIDATELNARRLMFKGLPVSMLPWLMADTFEHMFRTDMLILMQYLAKKIGVPPHAKVSFDDVLVWLRDGNADHCRPLAQWLEERTPQLIRNAPIETDDVRAQLLSGMYLTHPHLSVGMSPLDNGDTMKNAAQKLAGFIYHNAAREFQQYCQLRLELGEAVLQYTLSEVLQEPMAWPAVFGTLQTLPHFWFGVTPPDRAQRERLILTPLRLVRTEASKLHLCVDIRWLLMVSTIAGSKPCQAMRHAFVSTWIKHFYKRCMPRCLIYSDALVTGLPSPMMGLGVLTPRVIETQRKVLGRPGGGSAGGFNHTVSSPTGMVEDMAVVAERYQMAKWLDVEVDAVPTDSVSYTFPWKVWVPCVLEDDYETCVSVRFEGNGVFRMYNPMDKREVNITAKADDEEEQSYLEGRITENLRPLCFFDRPGVLLFMENDAFDPAIILQYNHKLAKYMVRTHTQTEHAVEPLEMERMVCCIGQRLLVKAQALLKPQEEDELLLFVHEDSSESTTHPTLQHVSSARISPEALLLCTLRVPDDDTLDALVPIMVRSFPSVGYGDAMGMDSMEDDVTVRLPPLLFHVPIDQVVARLDPDASPMNAASSEVFGGMSKI